MTNFSSSDVPGAPSTIPGTPTSVPGAPSSIPGSVPILNLNGGDFTLRSGAVSMNMVGFAEIQANAIAFEKGIEDLRHRVCQELAKQMEAWAKANAPWEDRTGDAREGLRGEYVAESGPNVSAALIAHTVEYGVFLETMQGGAFQILMPTVLHFIADLGKLMTEEGFEFATSGTRII